MKIKNGELGNVLEMLHSLRVLTLNGDISLAIAEFKADVKGKLAAVEAACTGVAESLCSKDEKDKPVTKVQQTNMGAFLSYVFPSVEIESEAKVKVDEINQIEREFTISPSSLTIEMIAGIKCTSDQAEALKMLIVPKLAKA